MKPLPKIGKPATRALNRIGLTSLEQLRQVSAKSLSKLHGVGPKAILRLETALKEAGLTFGSDLDLEFEMDFLALGDLNCDNAPKRRMIRNYLLSAWSQNALATRNYASLEVHLTEAGHQNPLEGLDSVLTAYQVSDDILSLMIHQILSHGKECAAHASLTLSSGQQISFAEFYQFESHRKDAKIIKITRYLNDSSF